MPKSQSTSAQIQDGENMKCRFCMDAGCHAIANAQKSYPTVKCENCFEEVHCNDFKD